MHGQPCHTTQVCCSTLADVVIVAAKVLVCQLRRKSSIKLEVKCVLAAKRLVGMLLVTHSESIAPLPAAVVHGVSSV